MISNNANIITWDMKEIINSIVAKHPEITEIYLFGSRAYKTSSYRSDIDLLAISKKPIAVSDVNSWLHDEYPPVDLFISFDLKNASSVVNGSCIYFREDNKWGFKSLVEQIDAICLWNINDGFSSRFSDWKIQTIKGINFLMSIIPSFPMQDMDDTMKKIMCNLETAGIKTFFAGSDCSEITKSVIDMVEIALKPPTIYSKRAKNFSFDKIKLENEYDFQNFIYFLLRPVFRDIQSENLMIKLDGQEKIADFCFSNNKIVIEAKWIDNKSKES